jgi:hypothetical protein
MSKVTFLPWQTEQGELNKVYSIVLIGETKYNARQLLKRIKESALALGYKDYTYGKRENALQFLQLRTKDDEDFVTIELRRSIFKFPFRLYLKAFNDGEMDKIEFENNLQKILSNVSLRE